MTELKQPIVTQGKPKPITKLPAGDYPVKIINSSVYDSKDGKKQNLAIYMNLLNKDDPREYTYTFTLWEADSQYEQAYGYKQLTRDLLPAIGLEEGSKFNAEQLETILKGKYVSIKTANSNNPEWRKIVDFYECKKSTTPQNDLEAPPYDDNDIPF